MKALAEVDRRWTFERPRKVSGGWKPVGEAYSHADLALEWNGKVYRVVVKARQAEVARADSLEDAKRMWRSCQDVLDAERQRGRLLQLSARHMEQAFVRQWEAPELARRAAHEGSGLLWDDELVELHDPLPKLVAAELGAFMTRLFEAVKKGSTGPVRDLLGKLPAGVSMQHVSAYYRDGCTISHACVHQNDQKMLRVLYSRGVDLSAVDVDGFSPFHEACTIGSIDMMHFFVHMPELRVLTLTKDRANPLHYLAGRLMPVGMAERVPPIISAMVQFGVFLDAATRTWQHTALHKAAMVGNTVVVRTLLFFGANVNVADSDGHTPLHWAIHNLHLDAVDLLVHAGADMRLRGKWGSPLEMAKQDSVPPRLSLLASTWTDGFVGHPSPSTADSTTDALLVEEGSSTPWMMPSSPSHFSPSQHTTSTLSTTNTAMPLTSNFGGGGSGSPAATGFGGGSGIGIGGIGGIGGGGGGGGGGGTGMIDGRHRGRTRLADVGGHQLVDVYFDKPSRCGVCGGAIPFFKSSLICARCGVHVHPKCLRALVSQGVGSLDDCDSATLSSKLEDEDEYPEDPNEEELPPAPAAPPQAPDEESAESTPTTTAPQNLSESEEELSLDDPSMAPQTATLTSKSVGSKEVQAQLHKLVRGAGDRLTSEAMAAALGPLDDGGEYVRALLGWESGESSLSVAGFTSALLKLMHGRPDERAARVVCAIRRLVGPRAGVTEDEAAGRVLQVLLDLQRALGFGGLDDRSWLTDRVVAAMRARAEDAFPLQGEASTMMTSWAKLCAEIAPDYLQCIRRSMGASEEECLHMAALDMDPMAAESLSTSAASSSASMLSTTPPTHAATSFGPSTPSSWSGMMGLMAIHPGHRRWTFVLAVLVMLRRSVGESLTSGRLGALRIGFFDEVVDVSGMPDGLPYICKEYAPHVFARLRARFGVQPWRLAEELGPERLLVDLLLRGRLTAPLQMRTSARSGSLFLRSPSGPFILKTLPPEELSFLLRSLRSYYDHMSANAESLLTRFLGLYSVRHRTSRDDVTYIVVMANVFENASPLEQYDLKGSKVDRLVQERPEDMNAASMAMKDMNFRRVLDLGMDRKCYLLQQLERDTLWLESHNLCDYSLLVGVYPPSSSALETRWNHLVASLGNERYCLGVIDILTVYNLKKRGERWAKSFRYDPQEISAMPPKPYRNRFLRFVCAIIT